LHLDQRRTSEECLPESLNGTSLVHQSRRSRVELRLDTAHGPTGNKGGRDDKSGLRKNKRDRAPGRIDVSTFGFGGEIGSLRWAIVVLQSEEKFCTLLGVSLLSGVPLIGSSSLKSVLMICGDKVHGEWD
jgi:hypothetical protein